jgi:hypothetical protein
MKKTNVTGYHVEVTPRSLGNLGFASVPSHWMSSNPIKDIKERCDGIADEIKRHVDNIQYVEVVEENEKVCEFCGRFWTEDSDTYNGGCCDDDEKNNPEPYND